MHKRESRVKTANHALGNLMGGAPQVQPHDVNYGGKSTPLTSSTPRQNCPCRIMAYDSYLLLRKCAADVSRTICCAARERSITPYDACFAVAHDVAVRLQLIDGYLESLPPYWIEPDVEELCRTLLQELLDITTVRADRWDLRVETVPMAAKRLA